MKKLLALLTFLALTSIGCSQQSREVNSDVSSNDMLDMLDESLGLAASSSGSANLLNTMRQREDTIYFFAQSSPVFGTPANVVSFADFNIMGLSGYRVGDIEDVKVFFIDGFDTNAVGEPRASVLVIDIKPVDSTQRVVKIFESQGAPDFSGGQFSVLMSDNQGQEISLQSYDVEGTDLFRTNIQLKVYEHVNGQPLLLGKISALAGYESFN